MLVETLLNTGLFFDNEYFYNYIQLIENNKNTKKQKFKTQMHHIIPVCACELLNLNYKNADWNKVNLLYKDHILAHYYLALCSKKESFLYKMVAAIQFILGKSIQVNLPVEELKGYIKNLDRYQEIYERSKKYLSETRKGVSTVPCSEEKKQKISKKNKGKIYVNKNGIVRSIYPDDLQMFLDEGWIRGNPNCYNNHDCSGRKIIHKDNLEKYCKQSELEYYLAQGWIQGHSDKHKESCRQATLNHNKNLTQEEMKKYGHSCSYKGKERPNKEIIYEKVKQTRKLNPWKQSEEQKLKNSENKKGTVHLTNGIKNVMVKPDKVEFYLGQGFWYGRTIHKKNKK